MLGDDSEVKENMSSMQKRRGHRDDTVSASPVGTTSAAEAGNKARRNGATRGRGWLALVALAVAAVIVTRMIDVHPMALFRRQENQAPNPKPPARKPPPRKPPPRKPPENTPHPYDFVRLVKTDPKYLHKPKAPICHSFNERTLFTSTCFASNCPSHPPPISAAVQQHRSLAAKPNGFDWQAFRDLNPEVEDLKIKDENEALEAYQNAIKSGSFIPIYQRLKLTVKYVVCHGLFNQHYTHLDAIVVGAALGGEIVLPHALKRDTYNVKHMQTVWLDVHFDTLWNSTRILEYAKERQLCMKLDDFVVHQFSTLNEDKAFQEWAEKDASSSGSEGVYLPLVRDQSLDTVLRVAHTALIDKAREYYSKNGKFPSLVLNLGCPLLSVQISKMPQAIEIMKNLYFSDAVISRANKVLKGIDRLYAIGKFNGLHLRMETDAVDWKHMMGGEEQHWLIYVDAINRAKFDKRMPMYVASGLLSYDEAEFWRLMLQVSNYSSGILFKEQFLTPEDIAGMHSEQIALIDFLVMAKCEAFVGINHSTWSYFLAEYRALFGIPRSTATLINTNEWVPTEDLFHRTVDLNV